MHCGVFNRDHRVTEQDRASSKHYWMQSTHAMSNGSFTICKETTVPILKSTEPKRLDQAHLHVAHGQWLGRDEWNTGSQVSGGPLMGVYCVLEGVLSSDAALDDQNSVLVLI